MNHIFFPERKKNDSVEDEVEAQKKDIKQIIPCIMCLGARPV